MDLTPKQHLEIGNYIKYLDGILNKCDKGIEYCKICPNEFVCSELEKDDFGQKMRHSLHGERAMNVRLIDQLRTGTASLDAIGDMPMGSLGGGDVRRVLYRCLPSGWLYLEQYNERLKQRYLTARSDAG